MDWCFSPSYFSPYIFNPTFEFIPNGFAATLSRKNPQVVVFVIRRGCLHALLVFE